MRLLGGAGKSTSLIDRDAHAAMSERVSAGVNVAPARCPGRDEMPTRTALRPASSSLPSRTGVRPASYSLLLPLSSRCLLKAANDAHYSTFLDLVCGSRYSSHFFQSLYPRACTRSVSKLSSMQIQTQNVRFRRDIRTTAIRRDCLNQ